MIKSLNHHANAYKRRLAALKSWQVKLHAENQKMMTEISALEFLNYQIISARLSGREGFDSERYKLINDEKKS